mgnify:FL=1
MIIVIMGRNASKEETTTTGNTDNANIVKYSFTHANNSIEKMF